MLLLLFLNVIKLGFSLSLFPNLFQRWDPKYRRDCFPYCTVRKRGILKSAFLRLYRFGADLERKENNTAAKVYNTANPATCISRCKRNFVLTSQIFHQSVSCILLLTQLIGSRTSCRIIQGVTLGQLEITRTITQSYYHYLCEVKLYSAGDQIQKMPLQPDISVIDLTYRTMANDCIVITFTMVKFLMPLAAFTEVLIVFTLTKNLSRLGTGRT